MTATVYLAGPITGLDHDECTDWRNYAVDELAKVGIKGLSPMRAKGYLKGVGKLPALKDEKEDYEYAQLGCLSTSRGIITRDRWDATRCDVLLVNLLGATIVSIGTVMEIAWADLKRTPIVCAIERNNIHQHGMLREAVGYRVETLEDAIDITKAILL